MANYIVLKNRIHLREFFTYCVHSTISQFDDQWQIFWYTPKNNKNLVNIALLYVKIFNNDNIIFPFYGEIVFH